MENTSGQGEEADIPQEIIWWNWGAFFLTPIWGCFGNKAYLPLLFLIPGFNIFFGYLYWVLKEMSGLGKIKMG